LNLIIRIIQVLIQSFNVLHLIALMFLIL